MCLLDRLLYPPRPVHVYAVEHGKGGGMSVSRGTMHAIQFLRFVAASLVVTYHAHLALDTSWPGSSSALENYLFRLGAVGVHIFFVISGYIMYLTTFGQDDRPYNARSFLMRRLLRIFPIYWIFVALYLLGDVLLGEQRSLDAGTLGRALLLWPGDASAIIGPAWTLSFELYFYAVFGVTMLAGARRGVWALTAFFVGSIAAGLVFGRGSIVTDSLLLEFLAGVWIGRVTRQTTLPRWAGHATLATAAVGYLAGLALGYERGPSAIMWGVPSALLVAGAVLIERAGGGAGIRRASVLGDSSYSLYLCHILLISIAVAASRGLGIRPPLLLATGAITVACILFAHLFYLAAERPLQKGLHRLTRSRAAAASPRAAHQR